MLQEKTELDRNAELLKPLYAPNPDTSCLYSNVRWKIMENPSRGDKLKIVLLNLVCCCAQNGIRCVSARLL